MKKIFSAIVAVTLAVVMCMSVSAAGGLNDNEKAVLDKLKNSKVVGANGWSFSIPTEYINTVENYFNNIDMTASQKDTILAKILIAFQHTIDTDSAELLVDSNKTCGVRREHISFNHVLMERTMSQQVLMNTLN